MSLGFQIQEGFERKYYQKEGKTCCPGFTQQYGIDFWETFSPTLKQDSLRKITAISVQRGFTIQQIDINSAYLNADCKKPIYISLQYSCGDI